MWWWPSPSSTSSSTRRKNGDGGWKTSRYVPARRPRARGCGRRRRSRRGRRARRRGRARRGLRPPAGRSRCRGRGSRSWRRIFAPGPAVVARSPPRRRARGARRARPPRRRRTAGRPGAAPRGRARRRGRRRPPSSSPSVRQTATSARLPGSSEPMSSRPSTAAPPRVPSRSASRDRQRRRAAAPARDEQRLLDLEEQVAALVRRRAVDAEPDAHARVDQVAHGRDAGPEPQVRRRAVRDAGAAAAKLATSCVERWTQCAHHTSPASQPSDSRYSTGEQPYSSRQYASSSTVSARCVWSTSPSRRASSADSRISSPVTENGEHGATATCTQPSPSCERGEPLRVGEHGVELFDERVRRQPALRLAEVHRAARGDDADAELARRAHLRLDEPARPARKHVVVVEDGRAARQRELGESGARRRVHRLLVDAGPDRIERLEPREEVGLLRPGPRERLVEVVVRVDEAGRDDCAAEIDTLVGIGRRAAADRLDASVRRRAPSRRRAPCPRRPSSTTWAFASSRLTRPPAGRARTARRRRARGR